MVSTARTTHTLNVAFMVPTEQDDWVNRLTARASKHPVCHTEIHFETVNQCFSVSTVENAGLRAKSLGNPQYRIVSLGVTAGEYAACLSFCQAATTWDLPLDEMAMWRSYYAPGCCELDSRRAGKTFCSKIVTEALQYAGVSEVAHLNPAITTPSRLYEALYRSPRIICASVPYKRRAMAQAPVLHQGDPLVSSMR